jgi:ketosteroid isomerase-like protein
LEENVLSSRPASRRRTILALISIVSAASQLSFGASLPAFSLETPTVTAPEQSIEQTQQNEQGKAEIEKILRNIESDWNAHNLEAVMGYYSDEYMNNDGLDKKAVSALTQDFWKTYPDAKSTSDTKQIRLEGNFATVESRDVAVGTTAKEMPGIGTKGELQSISEGQLYMRKQGNVWKIIGDRIDYEKVKVAFGLARQLNATFSAPEQVKAGRSYSAKLELNLPAGLTAVGSITSTPLQYPQPQPEDFWRPMNEPAADHPLLERVMPANVKNRNELLMATVGITNSARNSLMGIAFLTRRLNVVPNMEEEPVKVAADKEKEVPPLKTEKRD